ncbi:MAG: DNA repair protein RecO [Candidatus Omnitrophota bacterium]
MGVLKTEGIILKKYQLRETSYILIVYTKDFGKIKGVLKGARNPYPQFTGDLEIFTKCEVLFYKKKKGALDLISKCEAVKTFQEIRKDIERLTYANYFIELIDIATDDYDADEKLYNVLTGMLAMLNTSSSAKRTARIFEIKLLEAIGFKPELEKCVECGTTVEDNFRFKTKSGGIVCAGCGSGGLRISTGTVKFLRRIQNSELQKTFGVKVSKEMGKEIEIILRNFLTYHINKPIRSLSFLKELQKEGVV